MGVKSMVRTYFVHVDLVLNQQSLNSELEAFLMACGAIDKPDRRRPEEVRNRDNDESDDYSDDDSSSRMRSAATSTNARSAKNIREPTNDDSDFEFDM